MNVPDWSLTDCAWAAGIFEGEGSVRINAPTRRNRGALIVAITSTDEDLLEPFVEGWGGYYKPASVRAECKPAWVWTIAANRAASFLMAVFPFCRVARIKAKIRLGLVYQSQKQRSPLLNRAPEYIARQVDFFDRMKRLNRRGRTISDHALATQRPRASEAGSPISEALYREPAARVQLPRRSDARRTRGDRRGLCSHHRKPR